MTKVFKSLFAGLALSLGAQAAAHAQLISVVLPPAPAANAPASTPTVTNSAEATGSATIGSGISLNANTFYAGWDVGGTESNNTFPATLSAAETDAAYYSITITPTAGEELTLTNFDLSTTTLFSGDGTVKFALESSVTGFGAEDTLATYTGTDYDQNTINGTDVALSAVAPPTDFVDLTTPVEFRLYVYAGTNYDVASLIHGPINIDGVATPSIVNTPEPSSVILLGLGFAGLLIVGRNGRFQRA